MWAGAEGVPRWVCVRSSYLWDLRAPALVSSLESGELKLSQSKLPVLVQLQRAVQHV